MARDYVEIGSSPCEETCVQVGAYNYAERSRAECKRFIDAIRLTLGDEVGTARLYVKSNPHDFGTYHEVACSYDDTDEIGAEYAYRCESDAPSKWPKATR
jgi:hypothetical protein